MPRTQSSINRAERNILNRIKGPAVPRGLDLIRYLIAVKMPKDDSCLEWTGPLSQSGYGTFRSNGQPAATHRAAYELANGPIPEGLLICHKCDNPPCFRPDHLFVGTNADNAADRVAKGREPRGSERPNAVLDEAKVRWARAQYMAGTMTLPDIATALNINYYTVQSAVSRRKCWNHV